MKALFALLSLLAWNEPEVGDRLALTQEISLGSSNFTPGKTLRLQELEPLDISGSPLMHYLLVEESCEHPEAQSEMEIITPNGNDDSTAVGVELNPGCNWEIWLEQKDLYTSSFFSKAVK